MGLESLRVLNLQLSYPHSYRYHCNPKSFYNSSGNLLLKNVKYEFKLRFITTHTACNIKRTRWRRPSSSQEVHPHIDSLKVAQKSLESFLCDLGLSNEDAETISSGAPKYTQMLVDAVQELDDDNLWSSWRGESEDMKLEQLSFHQKVIEIARTKGDKGIAPFLESVGVNPSSTLYLSRYLLKESIEDLIQKINYLKELFNPAKHGESNISCKVQRMMMRLSIPADDDLQKTLSFFEKMEAQRGGLRTLDSAAEIPARLIESFPKILTQPVDTHIRPIEDFLESIGVPRISVGVIFLCFPPLFLYRIDSTICPRMRILKKAGVSAKDIGKMVMRYPWLLNKSIVDNIHEIIHFFTNEEIPLNYVKRAITGCPQLLGCSTSKLKMTMNEIRRLNVDSKVMAHVVFSSPRLFLRRPQDFTQVVTFLQELGLDSESIVKILGRCPEIFGTEIESTLQKKVDFLSDIGIGTGKLQRVLKKYPDILVRGVDQSLKPRIDYLEHVGFSKTQVAFMICGFPPILGYSLDVLKPKIEYLIHDMAKSIDEVVAYPRYFSYSLDNKIKRRFSIMQRLKIQCDLKTMLSKSDDEFAEEYLGVKRMLVPPVGDI